MDQGSELVRTVLLESRAPIEDAQLPTRQPVVRVDFECLLQNIDRSLRLTGQSQHNGLACEPLGVLRELRLKKAELHEGVVVTFLVNQQHSRLIN